MTVLKTKYAYILTLVLVLQAALYYSVAYRSEHVPAMAPLSVFPTSLDGWRMTIDAPIEKEILDLLKADDTLNRQYVNSAGTNQVGLFVAYFRTQRYGQNPHSPKNCLPGNGWESVLDMKLHVTVPVWDRDVLVNQYVVQHGGDKSLVLYWYQSHNRVIASEYFARMWLVADAIRYHRSDTSIVRVVVPVRDNGIEDATRTGLEFIRAMFPKLLQQLPA